jgi:type III pantothenate kinase
MSRILLIDISNSFTKAAITNGDRIGRIHRFPTTTLKAGQLNAIKGRKKLDGVILSSVVPAKTSGILATFPDALVVVPELNLGVGIDYPNPSSIGADRLANAAGCAAHYGFPAIVVDFGTAVTFDVLSTDGDYIGGVIAPGLSAMTHYLHEKTALLPLIKLREPSATVGKSTHAAMLSGAVHGYRGLIREIIQKITAEAFSRKKPRIIATGGDAALIAGSVGIFDEVDPLLTLRGLLVIAKKNLPPAAG